MRIVTPYRPFAPESPEHKEIGAFDWLAAIDMLTASARRAPEGLPVAVITDDDSAEMIATTKTDLSAIERNVFGLQTVSRRLMPWIVEVCLRYIESDAFDQDTVMISPDTLVFGRLGHYFANASFDLGLIARSHETRPMLNGLQFWPVASKARLVELYRSAYAYAWLLPEEQLVWGGDTTPFVELFGPAVPGAVWTGPLRGARVKWHDAATALLPYADTMVHRPPPADRLVDFRFRRKHRMRSYFDQKFKPLVERNGWFFPADDSFMRNEIDDAGRYQYSHLVTAVSHCRQRRLAVDGGAHVGTWSVPLGSLFGRVISFEPSADTFEALMRNLDTRHCGNVKPRQAALGREFGRIDMTMDERATSMGNLGARFVTPGLATRLVPLDSLGLQDLDFLKLDVEGSEPDALLGAMETLRRCHPVILFEDKNLWKRYGYEREAPQKLLTGIGARQITRVAMDEVWGWPA